MVRISAPPTMPCVASRADTAILPCVPARYGPAACAAVTSTVAATPSRGHGLSWFAIMVALAATYTQLDHDARLAAGTSQAWPRHNAAASVMSPTTSHRVNPLVRATTAYVADQTASAPAASVTRGSVAGAARPRNAAAAATAALPARRPAA